MRQSVSVDKRHGQYIDKEDVMTGWDDWIGTSFLDVGMVIASAVGIYLSVIVFTRIAGPRSFSKLSAFDFAMTVAVGTLIGTAASGDPPMSQAVVAIATLYALQVTIALIRRHSPALKSAVDNEPVLLMAREQMLRDNMAGVRITESDLWAIIRQAGVASPENVLAVVMETTGDVSVLKSTGPGSKLDRRILAGVRDGEKWLEDAL